MSPPPARVVTLVLCDPDGAALGSLPAFRVDLPWWPEVAPVVQAARALFGIDVTVLRLLAAGPAASSGGGPVTYLAETTATDVPALRPPSADVQLRDEPRRMAYACPGGPAHDLAWADAELQAQGTPRTGPAEQVRTWNLSSLWRLPVPDGYAWLKVVPPFFAHEGPLLAHLQEAAPGVAPPVLAAGHGRVLLADVPGDDLYAADLPTMLRMVSLLVRLQVRHLGELAELQGLGLPDWRGAALVPQIERVLARNRSLLGDDAEVLEPLVSRLPGRLAELAACGIPDSLVHGDFHPGNLRGDLDPGAQPLVLLDWGDSGIGHPLLDQAAFVNRVAPEDRVAVGRHWAREWRAALPASEPLRAAELLRPLASLRQAVVYQHFLDSIEPDERPYHSGDVLLWLRVAAAQARDEGRRC